MSILFEVSSPLHFIWDIAQWWSDMTIKGLKRMQVRFLLSRFTELAVKAKKNHITRKTYIFMICVFWFFGGKSENRKNQYFRNN